MQKRQESELKRVLQFFYNPGNPEHIYSFDKDIGTGEYPGF